MRHILLSLMMMFTLSVLAQNVTYNHDSSKKNQIMVMEIGGGSLSPDFYYRLLHNNYRSSAPSTNKMAYRTTAGIAAYSQVADAETIDTALTARAKIEALNVADRQVDLAWLTEKGKINDALQMLHNNINMVVATGGSIEDRRSWQDQYDKLSFAIKATRDAYMPNAQRKREYLQIYSDITKCNDALCRSMKIWASQAKIKEYLDVSVEERQTNKKKIVKEAFARWRHGQGKEKTNNIGNININD